MSGSAGGASEVIALPKGGGAVQGIGEKFSADPHTGTGTFTIPIAVPPGRNGLQPDLRLQYSSAGGNGPFGLGWSVGVPAVTRKTSKGVPRYEDERDVFILAGGEDLVPIAGEELGAISYRPRTEGLFARITHYRRGNDDFWEVRARDGQVSVYGTPGAAGADPATVADPRDRRKVFTWMLTSTTDPFGNRIEYRYFRDTPPEDDPRRWEQLYLLEVRYADHGGRDDPRFLITVSLVYEPRPDAFSEYRAGFEIRTALRCTRIETHTHADVERLTRTHHLVYLDRRGPPPDDLPLNGVSLLSQIRVEGHDGARSETLPSLELGYTRFEPGRRDFMVIEGADLPPGSLARPEYELADLVGNGLPDVLEMNGTVRYWRNLGGGRFDRPRNMREAPGGVGLADPGVRLLDANGDGRLDLLVTNGTLAGYFPLRFGGFWDRRSFQRYRSAPSFSLDDPEVRLVDLDGDGVTDAIRSGARLECFFNDPSEGWRGTRRLERRALDEFPNVNFSDERVRLADMNGDGLTDVVLVYDGGVEYWPSLGRGDWAGRMAMANSPRFPFGYDPRRVLLGDVDGDGRSDIVYVDDTSVTLWINRNGESWSDPIEIRGTPPVSDVDALLVADVLGTGVAGVLWSRDADGSNRSGMFFLDFTGGVKPYLLHHVDNRVGAETRVEYAPSTRFRLEDERRPETRWKTPLPFPVQVVARVETIDQISGGKLTTEYRYHHGYWDGVEREFRGFGRVDQRDTELFGAFHATGLHGADRLFQPVAERMFSPPTETRTWFHQGAIEDERGDFAETDHRGEYWPGDPTILARPSAMADALKALPRAARRDALRALRGMALRTELYALDGTERQDRPHVVRELVHGVREESPPGPGREHRPRIFFPHLLGQRATHWERGDDPMTQLTFFDDHDAYGQARSEIRLGVPRGRDYRAVANADEPYLCTQTESLYAQVDTPDRYIVNRVARTTTYEIPNDGSLSVWILLASIRDGTARRDVVAEILEFYDGPAFEGLPLGQMGNYGASVRRDVLILTDPLVRAAYRGEGAGHSAEPIAPYLDPDRPPVWSEAYPTEFRDRLLPLAGYIHHRDGDDAAHAAGYFAIAERKRFDFHDDPERGRGLLRVTRDALGHDTSVAHDAFDLLPTEIRNAVGMSIAATYDYRVMEPSVVVDANGNRTVNGFTPLGLLESVAVSGKSNEGVGDTPESPSTRWIYDFHAFASRGRPVSTRAVRRVHHARDDVGSPDEAVIQTIQFFDGFGRLVQTRSQAQDVIFGAAPFGDSGLPADRSLPAGEAVGKPGETAGAPAVVVNGWQIYDNKGRVVEQYEPFFSTGFEYDPPGEGELGQKITRCYDPRGQVVRTVWPDGAEQRVVYGVPGDLANPDDCAPTAWESYLYDRNDNAGRTHADRGLASQSHWDTPVSTLVDAFGRAVGITSRNGPNPEADWFTSDVTYDIRGDVLAATDALGRIAYRQTYDLAGRPIRVEHPDGGIRHTLYDAIGNVIEHRDSKGTVIVHACDELDRPIRLWARDSADQPMALCERTVYGDAPESGLSSAQAAASNLLGRIFRHLDQSGSLTFAGYDFKGSVLQTTRRVVSDAAMLARFDPPPPDWRVPPFRADWQPPAGSSLRAWSARILDETAYQTSFRYDALNRVTSMRYPEAVDGRRRELRLHYDSSGALERIDLDAEPLVRQIARNAKGQRTLIAYANGLMTRYAYDPRACRLTRLRTERYTTPAPSTHRPTGLPLQDLSYDYDLVGNPTAIEDRTEGCGIPGSLLGPDALRRTFTYDPLYRLLSATGRECDVPPEAPWDDRPRGVDLTRVRPYTEHYQYDPVGNLTRLQHQANGGGFTREFAPVPDGDRLAHMAIGGVRYDYAYDRAGSLLRETSARHFEWDYCDQLQVFRTQVSASEPSVHVQHVYDSAGRRVKKLVRKQGGQVEATVYVGGLFEHHRLIRNGSVRENNTLHVMDDGQRVAVLRVGDPFPDDTSPALSYQLGDHLGSSALVVDDTGSAVRREEFTPHGETSFGGFARKRYRFTGKERDEHSGLAYHGARFYAPWLARWTSCDPAGVVDGTNLYRYARGNPVALHDPSGMQSEGVCRMTVVEADRQTGEQRSYDTWTPCTGSDIPSEGSGGTGTAGSGDGNGTGTGGKSSTGTGSGSGSGRGFWSNGGGNLVMGVVGVGIGIAIVLSGPVGWFTAISTGLLIGTGAAGALAGGYQLATADQRSDEDNARFNEVVGTAMLVGSSIGGIVGGAVGWAFGGKEGLQQGAVIGGALELGVLAGAALFRRAIAAWPTRATSLTVVQDAWALPKGGIANGQTSWLGNITIALKPVGDTVENVLRHEMGHAALSPARGEFLAGMRASIKAFLYENSAFFRYAEEALAEGYATKSLIKGLKFPIVNGYLDDLTLKAVAIESPLLGAGGIAYFAGIYHGAVALGEQIRSLLE